MFIKPLDKNLANMIAAGEVVERPASAVKELIENSIDAGASLITVAVTGGGLKSIKVTDNGCGIYPEDVESAFMRHATSKISKADDLEAIYTLGFRGEALASIAAVAEVELYTRTQEFETGTTCTASYGEIKDSRETPGFVGTEIRVLNLFYNTPARLKFLKRDTTEAGYVEEVVKKTAIAHPEISFRYICDGKEKVFTPGDGKLLNTIFAIYGKEVSGQLLNVSAESDSVTIEGFVSNPVYTKKTRAMQLFYVNHRPIVSKLAANALQEAFKGFIPVNTYPVCFININVSPSVVDVNVHPAKLEVKFSDEQRIYRSVYYAVKNALSAKIIPKIEEKEIAFEDLPKPPVIEKHYDAPKKAAPTVYDTEYARETKVFEFKSPELSYDAGIPSVKYEPENKPINLPVFDEISEKTSENVEIDRKIIKKSENYVQIGVELGEELMYNIIGQLFSTYILVQRGDELIIVDQHAAHEHITYAKLLEGYKNRSVVSQTMLSPEVVALSAADKAILFENSEFFENIGFEIENFGGNDILVRAVPENIDTSDMSAAITEILENLKDGRLDAGTSKYEVLLHTVACRASIKAGKKLDIKEAENLVRTLFEIEKTVTCPHGRPAWFAIDKRFIEKQFKRIQ